MKIQQLLLVISALFIGFAYAIEIELDSSNIVFNGDQSYNHGYKLPGLRCATDCRTCVAKEFNLRTDEGNSRDMIPAFKSECRKVYNAHCYRGRRKFRRDVACKKSEGTFIHRCREAFMVNIDRSFANQYDPESKCCKGFNKCKGDINSFKRYMDNTLSYIWKVMKTYSDKFGCSAKSNTMTIGRGRTYCTYCSRKLKPFQTYSMYKGRGSITGFDGRRRILDCRRA